MKSVIIMLPGLAIAGWGAYVGRNSGFDIAMPWIIAGGVIFLVGAFVNHWEHTRKR